MKLFLVLQAALLVDQVPPASLPRLRNPQQIMTPYDYPQASMQANETGIVSVLLRISGDGVVDSCSVTETSGYTRLDRKTCSLIMSRAKFDPAIGNDGTAENGEYRTAMAWGLDQSLPNTNSAITLTVGRVPTDYKRPVSLELVFQADGKVEACRGKASSGSTAADETACRHLSRDLKIAPPRAGDKDIAPAAVRYVTASFEVNQSKR